MSFPAAGYDFINFQSSGGPLLPSGANTNQIANGTGVLNGRKVCCSIFTPEREHDLVTGTMLTGLFSFCIGGLGWGNCAKDKNCDQSTILASQIIGITGIALFFTGLIIYYRKTRN